MPTYRATSYKMGVPVKVKTFEASNRDEAVQIGTEGMPKEGIGGPGGPWAGRPIAVVGISMTKP